jgi:hypothetical protein
VTFKQLQLLYTPPSISLVALRMYALFFTELMYNVRESSSPDKSAAALLNQGDYNKRVPLHLAAEGGMEILRFYDHPTFIFIFDSNEITPSKLLRNKIQVKEKFCVVLVHTTHSYHKSVHLQLAQVTLSW